MNAPLKNPVIPTLATLSQLLLIAKAQEQKAKEERMALEQQILDLVGSKEEGTTTAEADGYRIKTVGKLTRSIDTNAVQADWDNLDPAIQKCIKWKADIDTKNLRSLESMRDDLVPVIAKYMTTKPAKPSVTIEELSN